MIYATAEASVALATILHRIRTSHSDGTTKISFDGVQEWPDALRLPELQNADKSRPLAWTDPGGCFAYPLHSVEITSRNGAIQSAQELVMALQQLPHRIPQQTKEDFLVSLARVATETFLNVFEHAYTPPQRPQLFACITATPAGHYRDNSTLAGIHTSAQELQWLAAHDDGLILEVAIADGGNGIPRTLWNNAKQTSMQFSSGWNTSPLPPEQRTAAHQSLCEYAFHHDSTRKDAHEFSTPASRLSWRGLHRSLRQTEHLSGSMVLASGRGRAGYVCINGKMQRILPPSGKSPDFPGTIVVLRVPLKPQSLRVAPTRPAGSTGAGLRVAQVASSSAFVRGETPRPWSEHLASRTPRRRTDRTNADQPNAVVAYFPFESVSSIDDLLLLVRKLPPDLVPVLLFADIPVPVRAELRAYEASDQWSLATSGSPRFLFIWEPKSQRLAPHIVGALPLPQAGSTLYSKLERTGFADLVRESVLVHELAADMQSNYRQFLRWDTADKTLSLTQSEITLGRHDFAEILRVAFQEFISATSDSRFVHSCNPDQAVRTPSGRLVRRFIKLLEILRELPVLRAALRERLSHVLEDVGDPGSIRVLAEGPASFFVATALLDGSSKAPTVDLLQNVPTNTIGSSDVIFFDIVYRNEAIQRALDDSLSDAGEHHTVLVCLDFRALPSPKLWDRGTTVVSLVTASFNPLELEEGEPEPSDILETDKITHLPEQAPCPFVSLGTKLETETFVEDRPELLRCGFHRLASGRLHTVSFDTKRFVEEHHSKAAEMVAGEIRDLLNTLPPRKRRLPLMIFSRPNSRVYSIVEEVGRQLQNHSRAQIFLSDLTVAPTAPKALFPRTSESIFFNVREVDQVTIWGPTEPSHFVGIYVDDASITGRALEDVLTKIASLEPNTAAALVAVVVTNRLSPRETRFFHCCRQISPSIGTQNPPSTQRNISFRFGSLFRLQVGTADPSEPGGAAETIRSILDNERYFDKALRHYASSLKDNLRLMTDRGQSWPRNSVLLHPYHPGPSPTRHVDTRVVWLRHLLALNQQNEGVAGEILRLFSDLADSTAKQDLLALLALEPQFVQEDPLVVECRQRLRDLCIQTISGEGPDFAKSDALALLAQEAEHFLACLPAILTGIRGNESLESQVCGFLQMLSKSRRASPEQLRNALDQSAGAALEIVDRLRNLLALPTLFETSFVVTSDAEALDRLHEMLAQTWAHIGLEDWQAFDNQMKRVTASDPAISDPLRSLGNQCAEYAERVLLPGLAALQFLANRQLDSTEANQLWEALIDGLGTLSRFKINLQNSDPSSLSKVWTRLRALTLKAASPIRSLGTVHTISATPSAIETFLPRLFAAPLQLLTERVRGSASAVELTTDLTIKDDAAIVVPAPTACVGSFLRLLTENMERYSVQGSQRVQARMVMDSQPTLVIEIFDQRNDQPSGAGNGTPLMREFARRGHFGFKSDEASGLFRSTISFPNALCILPPV